MTPVDLDDLLDRELKRLPEPAAPRTLLPRVMAAVEQRVEAAWYRRAWLTWPIGWQIVSIVALAVLVTGIALLVPGAQRAVGNLTGLASLRTSTRAVAAFHVVQQSATLMRVSWQVFLQPVATYVAVLALLMSLGCAAFWTALNRMALGGASHQ